MPITEAAVQALLTPLARARPITSRKMFGGVGIYADGVFFAIIDDDRLYFKSDEQTASSYDKYDAAPWAMPGGPPTYGYREVPGAILESDDLGDWIDAAIAVANRKKAKGK